MSISQIYFKFYLELLSKPTRKGPNQKGNINTKFVKWSWNNRYKRIKNIRKTFDWIGKN